MSLFPCTLSLPLNSRWQQRAAAERGTRWWLPPPRNSVSSRKILTLPWGTSTRNAQETTEPVPGTALQSWGEEKASTGQKVGPLPCLKQRLHQMQLFAEDFSPPQTPFQGVPKGFLMLGPCFLPAVKRKAVGGFVWSRPWRNTTSGSSTAKGGGPKSCSTCTFALARWVVV